jgi:hypothetical protein
MIPVEYYIPTYFACLSIVVLFSTIPLLKYNQLNKFPKANLYLGSIFMLVVVIGFIGLRDPWGHWLYFGDTSAYTRTYELMQQGTILEFNKDFGFYVFMKLCSQIMGVQGFFITAALIYVGLPYLTFRKWFGQYAFFALAAFVSAMSFLAFGINGVRNGLASSIFIFALGHRDKKWLMYGVMILSITFHKSMMLPMSSYIIVSYYKNTKVLILFWILVIPISLIVGQGIENLVSTLLSADTFLDDSRAESYFTGDDQNIGYKQRFRWDFVIYSGLPILLGWWLLFKKRFQNTLYIHLLNTYIIANGIWILLIYIPYTDRLAYLSWFIMPILLVYPFIYMNNQKKLFLLYLA